MNKRNYQKQKKPKSYYPAQYKAHKGQGHRKPHAQKKQHQQPLFQGNLMPHIKHQDGYEVSGYVRRTVIIKDRYGNQQIAKEKQFFNTGKNLGRVKVIEDEADF